MKVSISSRSDKKISKIPNLGSDLYEIYWDNWSPFMAHIFYLNKYYNYTSKWFLFDRDGSGIFYRRPARKSDFEIFFKKHIEKLSFKTEAEVYYKLNALFINYEPYWEVFENEVAIDYKIEIDAVYEGCYFDYLNIDQLPKVDLSSYQPVSEDKFNLLIRFKLLIIGESSVPEYLYYTVTSPKKVVTQYQKYFKNHPEELITFSYKIFCQKKFNVLTLTEYLEYYFERIKGTSKEELLLKYSTILDYPKKDELLQNRVPFQDKKQVTDGFDLKFYFK